ncbi:MAG: PspC domain-containing protein [Cytophagaceae bacterium]|nr:PspC domain-containing protein [Cytophagaceae bacterium]
MNPLHRIPSRAVLGGVAAGLADYFRTDVLLVRLIFVVGFFLTHGPFGFVYLILWIALPKSPQFETTMGLEASNLPASGTSYRPDYRVWGGVLIGLGTLFLLDEFTWWFDWDKIWPLGLVGIGLYLIFKDRLPQNRADTLSQSQSSSENQPPQPNL